MHTQTAGPARVLIAIQARSASTRFPGKIYEEIGSKMVLTHVIDAAKKAKKYCERSGKMVCEIAVLYPDGDQRILDTFKSAGVLMIAGPEHDVLARYLAAQRYTAADYVVRLTSDCPLVFPFIISKHINVAVYNRMDYVSNVDEECRMFADGLDCEAISANAIAWLSENAKTPEEREHVTLAIRKKNSQTLSKAFISSQLDTSAMKLSIDTQEDLDRVRLFYHGREFKMDSATISYGRDGIFEL
jgi:spore coat polysaccharide biosynthesis protein SpsF